MNIIAEIFSQGEEVVSGQIVDTNAAWLAQQLNTLGFTVTRHTAVGDQLPSLVTLIKEIANRADCCICTGGLGPTSDDLTAQAVSEATGIPLQFDAAAFAMIAQFYQRRQRAMPEANRKQAYLPATAQRIDNGHGTAPGFTLKYQRCWFVFLPGVPVEMQAMFVEMVKQQLLQIFTLQPACLVSIRSIGIGESAIQANLAALKLPPDVQLGFRVTTDDVQTKLLFPAGFSIQEKQAWVAEVVRLIGDYVFAIDGIGDMQGNLLTVINNLMEAKNYSLSILETVSQGLIAAKCAGRTWLNHVDICLDVQQLQAKSGCSDSVADLAEFSQQIARNLKNSRCTDWVLVQLHHIDEPLHHEQKSRILLYNTLCTVEGTVVTSQHTVVGNRNHIQNQAALLALDLLRRHLQTPCL